MGSTDYYQALVPVRTLTAIARPAREMDEWAAQGIEERLQRDLNGKRIREEIVPYLTRSKDRFFGSLIVLVHKPAVFEYESLPEILGSKVPAAYRRDAQKMGFLTIDGGELIALDGQHRLVALRHVVQKDFDPIAVGGEFESVVPTDDVSVIFIEFENNEKTRRIFNKVNRYAKPTGRGDNILLSEDDGFSIVTRRLLNEDAPLGVKDDRGGLLVNWKSNTLAANSTQFTTLSAVYEIDKDILSHHGLSSFDERSRVNRPSDEELEDAFTVVEEWWTLMLDVLDCYKQAMSDYKTIPKLRDPESKHFLLFKPATQIALFRGILDAHQRGVSKKDVIQRANQINWRLDNDMWKEILVSVDGRMLASRGNIEFAARIVHYLVGAEKWKDIEVKALRNEYREKRGNMEGDELPEPIK